ncbi:MAG TPA: Dabb family protein [Solirubrobacterales bacterium]
MIYHIARFSFEDGLSSAEEEKGLQMLRELGDIDSTTASIVCQDVGGEAAGFTHSQIVILDGEDRYTDYHADPFHAEVIQYVIPRLKKLMICDATEDLDPALAGRFAKAQEGSPAMTPAVIAKLEQIMA